MNKNLWRGLTLLLAIHIHVWAAGMIEANNNSLIREKVREFGHNPDRLTPEQREKIEDYFYMIRPGDQFNRYPLNPAQARAIVFLALDYRGGGGPPTPTPNANLLKLIYELDNLVPEEQFQLFLSDKEKEAIRAKGAEIESAALDRNCPDVADAMTKLRNYVRGINPDRKKVRQSLVELKTLARQCQ